MKHCLPLLLLFLVACEQSGSLQWISPVPHSTVGGSVILEVDAPGIPPENVVFSANGEFIAKSYDLSAVWDTSGLPSGDYILEAKPFGLPSSFVEVRVHNVGAAEPETPAHDPLGLGLLLRLDSSPFREFTSRVPPGIDLRDILSMPAPAVSVQQTLPAILLPRGVYAYDPGLEDWIMEPGGENFLLTFDYSDETGLHRVEARITYGVTRIIGDQEVPEALSLRITDDARLLLELEAAAKYREVPSCGFVLEPETLDVVGRYDSTATAQPADLPTDAGDGAQPPTPIQDIVFTTHYVAADEAGHSILNARVDANAGLVSLYGQLDLRALLNFVRQDCTLQDVEPSTLQTVLVVGHLRRAEATGVRLTLDLSNIVRSPLAAVMMGALDMYGPREEVTRFNGELSDPNRDGVPGENALATLPSGIRRPVDTYLKNLWVTYLGTRSH